MVGVPEIIPVDAARVSPGGREVEPTDQVYGVAPPVACSVPEYGMLTWPFGSDVVVSCSGVGPDAVTAMLRNLLAACGVELESFACTAKEEVPATVGVPLTCPFEAVSASPTGNDPVVMDHV